MKWFRKTLNTRIKSRSFDLALLICRFGIGGFMLTHGIPKLEKLIGASQIKFPDPLGIGAVTSLSLVVFSEFLCSFLLILGLFSRLATIPLIITMLVAVFITHANDGFNKMEMGLHYLLVYLLILLVGPGRYSIDRYLYNKTRGRSRL
jgi:putative oxidoreductase